MRLKLYRGYWAIVWSEGGKTRRVSTRQADYAAAEIALKDYQHKLELATDTGVWTVGRAIRAYLDAHPQVINRPALVEWWHPYLPDHVTDATVELYLKSRAGRAPSTLRSEVVIMLTALRWAKAKRYVSFTPELEALPPESPPRERWITRAQAERLKDEARSPHMRIFTMLTIYTGARSGAILDLTWDRVTERYIDYNDPERPRTRKRRAVVPTHPELWEALVAARMAALTPYVVEYAERKVGSVKMAFRRQAKRAELDGIGPHALRHSVATWMAMEGVSMQKIADFLGNSVRMVEKVYAKFAPGYLEDAVQTLGRAQVVQLNQSLRDKPGTASDSENIAAKKRK
jgi:integrase